MEKKNYLYRYVINKHKEWQDKLIDMDEAERIVTLKYFDIAEKDRDKKHMEAKAYWREEQDKILREIEQELAKIKEPELEEKVKKND